MLNKTILKEYSANNSVPTYKRPDRKEIFPKKGYGGDELYGAQLAEAYENARCFEY